MVVSFTGSSRCGNKDFASLKLLARHQVLQRWCVFRQKLNFGEGLGEQGFYFDEDERGDLLVGFDLPLQNFDLLVQVRNDLFKGSRAKLFEFAKQIDLVLLVCSRAFQIFNVSFVNDGVVL